MKKESLVKRLVAITLVIIMLMQLVACSTVSDVVDKAGETAKKVKDVVVDWYKEIDLDCFKNGWDTAVEFMGNAYSAAVTSQYITSVGEAINNLKTDINSAYGSMRGIAQEAGYAAEKWTTDTFNIDSVARGSSYTADTVGSYDLGSADVSTNYGENASLKYYQTASGSAQAQAESIIKAYHEYAGSSKNPLSLDEYMDKNGYDYSSQDDLMASIYAGQTRIIPTDQLAEAKAYLQGRITKLSSIEGEATSARTKAYQETLANLKDRLEAPDGTSSKPATYEEMQAIAELSQTGEFEPEDFGISLSQVITPKYVLKQAIGTGLEAGALRTVFTIGPDLISILVEAAKNGELDEDALKETGIDGVIAFSEGFVEGSVSSIVVNLCKQGILGESLKNASPDIVGAFVYLTIEAVISGYSLVNGDITAEEYGCLMADKTLITILAIPTTAAILSFLPGTKLFMLIGCLAGSVIASTGYTVAKEIVLEFIDGGGFEAIVPQSFKDKISNTIESAKNTIASLDLAGQVSNLKDFAVSTAKDGLIYIKGIFD